MTSPTWLCPEHGRLAEADVDAGHRCRTCGMTALDARDPAARDAVAFARGARGARRMREWHAPVLSLAIVSLPFAVLIAAYGGVLAKLPLAVVVAVLALMWWFVVRERDAGWREPGQALRTLTSAPMIAIVACLAFVPVADAAGIEQLWYAAGDPIWRMATATLTHGSAMHLTGNLIGVAMFGFAVDRRIGRSCTAVVFAVSAATAIVPQSLASPAPMVGFSGVVYGLFGATLALMPARPQLLVVHSVAIPLPTWAWMCVIVPAYTVVDALDPSRHVAWIAHLGGFAGGFLAALPMRRISPPPAHVAAEERRRGWIDAHAREARLDDLFAGEGVAAASSNPEIAAFHRAARRRRIAITGIGGLLLFTAGLAGAGLAAYLEAPAFAAGRRITVIVTGLVMAVAGLAMLGAALFRRR